MSYKAGMTTFGNCASVFQLAFALNAVAVGSEVYFKSTRKSISERMLSIVRPAGSALNGPAVSQAFEVFILKASSGLRFADAAYKIISITGIFATLVSFIGLMKAGVTPNSPLANSVIWTFAVVVLLALPSVYWGYARLLEWFEDRFLVSVLAVGENISVYWDSFELYYQLERIAQSLDGGIELMNE